MNFGVIGYGYWGPNIVRNFAGLEGSKVLAIADLARPEGLSGN
jgi:predicted homoserine dehydrogenase-like protein